MQSAEANFEVSISHERNIIDPAENARKIYEYFKRESATSNLIASRFPYYSGCSWYKRIFFYTSLTPRDWNRRKETWLLLPRGYRTREKCLQDGQVARTSLRSQRPLGRSPRTTWTTVNAAASIGIRLGVADTKWRVINIYNSRNWRDFQVENCISIIRKRQKRVVLLRL